MAITITGIDSQSLNSTEGIRAHIVRNTSSGDFVATTTKRNRSNLTPVVTNEVFESRPRVVHISPDPAIINTSNPNDVEDYNALIHEIFMPWNGNHTLHGIDHNGQTYTALTRIKRFGRRGPQEAEAEIEFLNGVWKSTSLNTETTSPLTVGGSVFAQPVITLDGATSITRTRLTISDRTGHGIMGHMISVTALGAGASNHLVYMNGIEIPFQLTGGRLFFRVAALPAPSSTFVDIFFGASIDNTVTADVLDTAGITLDTALASGIVTTDPSDPFGNALPSSLSWHPGIVTRHPQNRGYTFGFDGANRIRLVDRSATGTQYNLPDDADAYILTSPVEISSISDLSLGVTAPYIPGQISNAGVSDERTMKVTISTIDGSSMVDAPVLDSAHVRSLLTPGTPDSYPAARNDYLFYAQFTFGEITFPHTWSRDSRQDPQSSFGLNISGNPTYNGELIQGTIWRNDYVPWEIQTLAEQFIGCTVTTGDPGVWYLHFPAESFNDIEDLPLLSMSLHEKSAEYTIPNNDEGQSDLTMIIEGDTSLNDILLFNSEWVDPDTLEPLDRADPDAPANEEPLAGTVTAFVAARGRDSEDWVTVWEQTIAASGADYSNTLTPTGLTGLNAVQVAVGLRSSSTNPNTVDAGTLSISSNPVITLVSGSLPNIDISSGLSAQHINGVLTNTSKNKYIQFIDVVGAAGGLIIDTENLTIQADTGPFYGRIKNNGGTRLFDLDTGNNSWSNTTGATVTFSWYDREAS